MTDQNGGEGWKRGVACPKCGASVGERCGVQSGSRMIRVHWVHLHRVRAAYEAGLLDELSVSDRAAFRRLGIEVET